MSFDLDRRIANALRRLEAQTDARCAQASARLANEERHANQAWLDSRYHFHRRALGQQLRWIRARARSA